MNQVAEDELIHTLDTEAVKSVKFLWVIKIYKGSISYNKELTNSHVYCSLHFAGTLLLQLVSGSAN